MKTRNPDSHHLPALEQLEKNASSWIGHMNAGSVDYLAGQTFENPAEGDLNGIQVYSDAVPHPGKVMLTFHLFNKESKSWGPVLSSSETEVGNNDAGHWINFNLPTVHLDKNKTYGFRLKSTDALIAIGEAVWLAKNSFTYGEEWNSRTDESSDHYYKYFSLAFKVELRA
jgi:hypothetical protein